jgi:hypothetical protein
LGLALATSGRAEPPGDAGPGALWEFDGTLEDRAGTARDDLTARADRAEAVAARFVAAPELSAVEGQAVALGVEPGDAAYLTAPVSADVRLGPSYTVELWIHPTHVGGWNRLVLNWGAAPKYAYHVGIHNGAFSLYHGQQGGEYVFAEGGHARPGRWYHLAAVARRNEADPANSTLAVYVNGRLAAEGAFNGTAADFDGENLGLGDSAGTPSGACRYRGYLDHVALWNRALSTEEIRAHWQQRADALDALAQEERKREAARLAEIATRFEKLGVSEIIFAERHPGRDGHYYANFGYSCIDPATWLHGSDGGRLAKLDLGTGELTVLVDDPAGAVRDPRVHYDAKKILFSYRKGGTHRYHLYEIGVDGTGLRQITDGPWDDVEPAYLPDGDLVFCSTRCKRWIGCWLAETATLHRCDPSGRNVRMLSSGSFTENTPAVLPDGRVLYTRWEYVNRDPVSFHHLWTMSPDGAGQMVYFGNMEPGGVFIDAKPIPGTDRVVFVDSPGHGAREHAGYVAVISGRLGPNTRSTMQHVSQAAGFRDPYPLSGDAFLVARANQVLLLDGQGNTEVLYTGDYAEVHEPSPIVARPPERLIATQSDSARPAGTLILRDVYAGRNMAGVRRGSIKKLLVLEDLPKPANFHGGGSQPIGHGVTSTLKRILGTVPVEPDGSAHFEVPAMRSLYFAVLDDRDRSVKQMRSFVTVQPGETTSCVGCHEPRGQSPSPSGRPALVAAARPPSLIEPIDDVPQVMDFPRDVQPVLDRHCVRCHSPEKPDGGVVLSGDRGPVFSLGYYNLFLHWQVKDTGGPPQHGTGRQPGNDRPYAAYSTASPLVDKTDRGHYDVELTPHDKKTLRLWIDGGAAYPGTYAAYGTGQVGGCWGHNRPVRVMADAWPSTPPAQEAIERRCGACHPPSQLPRHVTAQIPLDTWGDMLSWTRPLSRYSRHRLFNLSRPEQSLVLLAPLARTAGGYAEEGTPPDSQIVEEDRSRPPEPVAHPVVFADKSDPDYGKLLAHVEAAGAKLHQIKRFDMPGFRPNEHYVREMKRFGVLSATFDPGKDPIDVYAADEAYWRSFWHRPTPEGGGEGK